MDSEAADRFVRAAYYLDRLPPAGSPARAYAALLSVRRNAAQPFGTPDPARPNIPATIRRTLADPRNGVYAFESSHSPGIVRTHLDRVDFGRAARLDVAREGLVGDVTDRYEAAEPSSFASA
ncbi:linear amide C-N hydrolase [Streptomyces sp. NPDC007863]|uniref:linear amide C-N hydrolase n=1 Tax=Streptomyces sp. NPDC007863 TaxID=3154894 RepID=UPI0033E2BA19